MTTDYLQSRGLVYLANLLLNGLASRGFHAQAPPSSASRRILGKDLDGASSLTTRLKIRTNSLQTVEHITQHLLVESPARAATCKLTRDHVKAPLTAAEDRKTMQPSTDTHTCVYE